MAAYSSEEDGILREEEYSSGSQSETEGMWTEAGRPASPEMGARRNRTCREGVQLWLEENGKQIFYQKQIFYPNWGCLHW